MIFWMHPGTSSLKCVRQIYLLGRFRHKLAHFLLDVAEEHLDWVQPGTLHQLEL